MAKNIFSLYLLFFISSRLFAQKERIDTDRPDQTESVATVPKNYFQAELGFNKENTFYKNYDLLYPTALLKYGLTKFEFRLEINYRSSYEHLIPTPNWVSGFEPVEIGFKAALWKEKNWLPKTSLIGGLGLAAIASKYLTTDRLAPSFRFTMQNSLSEHIALGYNLGAQWDGFTNTPAWLYTFAPGFEIGKKWYAYVETFGFIQKNEKPQHNIDAGIAYYISDDVKIDWSGGFGISAAAPKNYIAIGGSFRFNTRNKK